jgi:DNA primase
MNAAIGTSTEVEELKRHRDTIRLFTSRGHFEKIGQNKYRTRCPFHSDSTASCDVFLHARDRLWIYKCLGCGAKGNVFQWLMQLDGISFPAAVQAVKEYLGSGSQQTFVSTPEKPQTYITYSLADYTYFERQLAKSEVARNWLWTERGIDLEKVRGLHLGYKQCIQSKVKELQDVLNKGWLIFPAIEGDRVLLLKYRSLVRKAFARKPAMQTSLFNSGAIDSAEDLYVTEGEFDAAVLVQANLLAVSIGSTTTPITSKMIEQIRRAKRVILAGDSDGVGVKKMQDLQAQIPGSLLLRWPGCRDANEFWLRDHRGDVEGFRERIIGLTAEKETV